jgi:hypothetical protein
MTCLVCNGPAPCDNAECRKTLTRIQAYLDVPTPELPSCNKQITIPQSQVIEPGDLMEIQSNE